jgi:SpoVK/Ycf46/Vps4 family AAA+-type ATPase
MATSEQIKALIRSHYSDKTERFYSLVLQIAAHEAMQGHSALAHDLRELVDAERKKRGPKVITFPENLRGLVVTEEPTETLAMLVIPDNLRTRLKRLISEYKQQSRLKSYGFKHRRKLLLIGPSGTGKTMTAKVIGHELKIPVHTIQVDRLVTKFMGETSAKLRQIFDLVNQEHGVYFFDEFDAIGGCRSLDNDVGEMRRVLNSFLQFIELDTSDSLIIAASNNPKLLDQALFRRFDDILFYTKPRTEEIESLVMNSLGIFSCSNYDWDRIHEVSRDLNQSEIVSACKDAIKKAILAEESFVKARDLIAFLKEKQESFTGLEI